MERRFNFTSQVCTKKIQSERLLALGLKKETADCSWISNTSTITGETHWRSIMGWFEDVDLPAWSLHRLIEILDIWCLELHFKEFNNPYDQLISYFEERVKEGFINKKYLEESICGKH